MEGILIGARLRQRATMPLVWQLALTQALGFRAAHRWCHRQHQRHDGVTTHLVLEGILIGARLRQRATMPLVWQLALTQALGFRAAHRWCHRQHQRHDGVTTHLVLEGILIGAPRQRATIHWLAMA
ncbi:hypothetical protein SY85_00025 [Flavisolibacter tropicus]|uniref:Uncharacterized protein n=1 Tax=Flavisolibacter tropicus TaxID=1492898 RepID=A0A172TQ75_9BACT|nr:hypothetical protein SY85_00025 [Flavisolibacter tropicus]